MALRRNLTGWLIDGAFRYTSQFEEQRLDKDSGMAGLPGVSERDQRRGENVVAVGAPQVRRAEAGLLRLWTKRERDRRGL